MVKAILKTKNKAVDIKSPNFKLKYKATIMKTVLYNHKTGIQSSRAHK